MFTYYTYYLEAKEAIIQRTPWSDVQKKEIQELVNKYPQKAAKIDWNKIKELKAADVLKILQEESKKDVKKAIRLGFEGLKEGTDYKILHEEENYQAYAPLTQKASATLGRDTRWCISMENDSSHWKNYTMDGIKFIFVFSPKEQEALRKIAIALKPNNNEFESFDIKDYKIDWDVFMVFPTKKQIIEWGKTFEIPRKYASALEEAIIKNNSDLVYQLLVDKNTKYDYKDNQRIYEYINTRNRSELLPAPLRLYLTKAALQVKELDPTFDAGYILNRAAQNKDIEIIQEIFKDGRIDVNIARRGLHAEKGWIFSGALYNAAYTADSSSYIDVVNIFIENPKLKIYDEHVRLAIELGDLKIFKKIISKPSAKFGKKNIQLLHHLIRDKNLEFWDPRYYRKNIDIKVMHSNFIKMFELIKDRPDVKKVLSTIQQEAKS